MIRRSPTLIPMADSDVQDIRDMVAKQKADTYTLQKAILRMKRVAEKPLDEEEVQMLLQLKDVAAGREKEVPSEVKPRESISGGSS